MSEKGPAEMKVSRVLLLTSARLHTVFVLRCIPGPGCEIEIRGWKVESLLGKLQSAPHSKRASRGDLSLIAKQEFLGGDRFPHEPPPGNSSHMGRSRIRTSELVDLAGGVHQCRTLLPTSGSENPKSLGKVRERA